MAPVDVDPQAYFRSSTSARFSGQTVAGALEILKDSLAGSIGMAGSDSTGKEFAGGYDGSAKDVLTSAAGLVDMSTNTADLIRVSGLNHQNAERASTVGGPPPAPVPIPESPATAVPTVPSAYGYGGNEPTGAIATAWQYVQQWVGYLWPDGDPERLEAAARAWNTAATTIRNAGTALDWAKDDLTGQQSPEIPAATAHLADLKGKFDTVAGACNSIERACNNLSQAIKDAHDQLIAELAEFAAEFVVGEVIFGVLVEVGGELWGNAAMAARAVIVAQRCATIIQELIELAKGAAGVAKAAGDAVAGIVKEIKDAIPASTTQDPNAQRLIELTEQALREFGQGIITLSPAQQAAIKRHPWLYNTYKGQVLDFRVKQLVDLYMPNIETTPQGAAGPDFINTAPKPGEAPWYDLTTQDSWPRHSKYDAPYGGPGGGIIWNSPGGVTYVPPKE